MQDNTNPRDLVTYLKIKPKIETLVERHPQGISGHDICLFLNITYEDYLIWRFGPAFFSEGGEQPQWLGDAYDD